MLAEFNPITALIGGVIIGLSATLLLAANGRIAGISGIAGGLLRYRAGDMTWRWLFVGGLLLGGWLYQGLFLNSGPPASSMSLTPFNIGAMILAGLLVGYGTRMGSGCTSGHGVCGLGRLSTRSLVATVTFMVTATGTVFVLRHILGIML